jgi:hypothetical protein
VRRGSRGPPNCPRCCSAWPWPLTLHEFALWLTFRDVYWAPEGRLSIDAVLLFGSLLSIALWGGPFLRDLVWLWSHVP